MTYTRRTIPDEIERALRERAAAEHKSPEQAIFETLAWDFDVRLFSLPSDSSQIEGDEFEEAEFKAARREQRVIDWENGGDGVRPPDLSGIAGQRLITPETKAAFSERRRVRPKLRK